MARMRPYLPVFIAGCLARAVSAAAEPPAIPQAFSDEYLLRLFVILTLAVMGVYNGVVYAMRPKDRSPLLFGIFCIFIALNNFVSTDFVFPLLAEWFPGAAPSAWRKVDIASVMASVPCFVMFLHAFFPGLGKGVIPRLIHWATLAFLLFVLLLSGGSLEMLFRFFFIVILGAIGYSLATGIYAFRAGQKDAAGVLLGIFILSAGGVNDVLWGMGYLHTIVLMPFATFGFTIIYSVLISRRFAVAFSSAERLNAELLENQRLRDEMQRRLAREQGLRQEQRRLTALLHSIEMPLCAVNAAGVIAFCNRAFEEMAGKTLADIAGTAPMQEYQLHGAKAEMSTVELELEDEQMNVLLFGLPGTDRARNGSAIAFVNALNRNRARIQSLENLLDGAGPDLVKANPALGHDLDLIDTALEQMGRMLVSDETSEERKRTGVDVLTLSLEYWGACTGKTKYELAEESGVWKVQTNPDGWKRTQTLDKYLDVKTFPQNPRWNQLFKTADFVLVRCKNHLDLRKKLEIRLQRLLILCESA
jgi:PAS domain-containing protein